MRDEKNNRDLGMMREITRRDFLNGVAVGAGASLFSDSLNPERRLAAHATKRRRNVAALAALQ